MRAGAGLGWLMIGCPLTAILGLAPIMEFWEESVVEHWIPSPEFHQFQAQVHVYPSSFQRLKVVIRINNHIAYAISIILYD